HHQPSVEEAPPTSGWRSFATLATLFVTSAVPIGVLGNVLNIKSAMAPTSRVGSRSADRQVAWLHLVDQGVGIDEWTLAGTDTRGMATSADVCRRAITDAANFRASSFKGTAHVQAGTTIEMIFESGAKAFLIFVCLPETVDPRRPKAAQ